MQSTIICSAAKADLQTRNSRTHLIMSCFLCSILRRIGEGHCHHPQSSGRGEDTYRDRTRHCGHQGGLSYYANSVTIIEKLKRSSMRGTLDRTLGKFSSYRVVDEVGYLPMDREGSPLFFQLVSRRYEMGSTIFTSNKSYGEWGEVLGDNVITSAVLDRVLHHSITVNVKGESYRLQARKRAGVPYLPPAKGVVKIK